MAFNNNYKYPRRIIDIMHFVVVEIYRKPEAKWRRKYNFAHQPWYYISKVEKKYFIKISEGFLSLMLHLGPISMNYFCHILSCYVYESARTVWYLCPYHLFKFYIGIYDKRVYVHHKYIRYNLWQSFFNKGWVVLARIYIKQKRSWYISFRFYHFGTSPKP